MEHFLSELDFKLKAIEPTPVCFSGGCDAVVKAIAEYVSTKYGFKPIFYVLVRDTYDLENNWRESNFCSHVVVAFKVNDRDSDPDLSFTFDAEGIDAFFRWDSKWNDSGRLNHVFSWKSFYNIELLDEYLYTRNNKDKPYEELLYASYLNQLR